MRAVDDAVIWRDVIDVPPEAIAFLRLAHRATQRLRDQLMAEADADHRYLALVRFAHEGLKRRDPRDVVVYAGRGAGDQDRLQPFDIRQRVAGGNADGIERDRCVGRPDHPREHLRIRSVTFAVLRTDDPGFDDRDVRHRDG